MSLLLACIVSAKEVRKVGQARLTAIQLIQCRAPSGATIACGSAHGVCSLREPRVSREFAFLSVVALRSRA